MTQYHMHENGDTCDRLDSPECRDEDAHTVRPVLTFHRAMPRESWTVADFADACTVVGVSRDGRTWACARPAGHAESGPLPSWHAGRDALGRPVRMVNCTVCGYPTDNATFACGNPVCGGTVEARERFREAAAQREREAAERAERMRLYGQSLRNAF